MCVWNNYQTFSRRHSVIVLTTFWWQSYSRCKHLQCTEPDFTHTQFWETIKLAFISLSEAKHLPLHFDKKTLEVNSLERCSSANQCRDRLLSTFGDLISGTSSRRPVRPDPHSRLSCSQPRTILRSCDRLLNQRVGVVVVLHNNQFVRKPSPQFLLFSCSHTNRYTFWAHF